MGYTNIGLVAYVKALQAKQYDTVYILSGIGRPLTEAKIRERIAIGDQSVIKKQAWLRTQIGKSAYDCVGAIKSYLMTKDKPFGPVDYEGGKYDDNVGMMWNKSPERAMMTGENHPDIPGLLVMTQDLGHVGVYIGKENGRKAYIECTITGDAWRVIKSYGYVGQGKIQWTRWCKYAPITYVNSPAPKPDPTPKPTPPTNGKIISEVGYELVLKTAVYERNKPTLDDASGKVLRAKGSILPYDAYQQINGYDWKRLLSGKWIPAGPISNPTEYASIRKIAAPTPTPPPVKPSGGKIVEGDEVIANGTPCKTAAGANPGTKLVNFKGKVTKVVSSGSHRFHVGSKGWMKESDLVKVGGSTAPKKVEVGDSVTVNGTPTRDSAGNGPGTPLKNFKGKVGIIATGAKNPYHITGKGWVPASAIGATAPSGPLIAEGNTVTVNGTPTKNAAGASPGTKLVNYRGKISKIVTTGVNQVHIEGKGWVPRSAIS